jgi:16S rRNA (adenine1518-N6/adenine1519-N6)-dimethyltransferase
MTKGEVLKMLEELKAKPLKSLGQNFLIDENIINKILEFPKTNYGLKLYEIGPGLGSLTKALYNKEGLMPVLIELDRSFANYWIDEGYEVYNHDALKFDWQDIKEPSVLISNLPYQISSRLLLGLFISNPPIEQMVLMFQKEVGQRLRASLSDKKIYGLVSIIAQLNWEMEVITDVSSSAFFPRPEIESQVLFFSKKQEVMDERKAFVAHLKRLFNSRRKKIKSTLKTEASIDEETLNKRPDALTPLEHLDLFKKSL